MPTDDVVTLGQRVSQLERRNRWLSLSLFGVVFALLLGAYGLVRTGLQASKTNDTAARVEKFAEITVGRINIAGPNGVNRIILAHEMPQAPFQGEMIERTVPPGLAGMIYCAPNGDEVGGIGVSGSEKGGHSLMALDYRNTPLEAIGFSTRYGPDGQSAGFVVMDNPRGHIDIKKLKAKDEVEIKRLQAMMVNRIELGVEAHNAQLTFKDGNGKDRIIIGVDANNVPVLKMLDEHGKEVGRLPAK